MTYDLAFAGPRNRYTVATDEGPVIVHNCGYGVGHLRFQSALRFSSPPVILPEAECKRIIDAYRARYPKIPALWRQADEALQAIVDNVSAPLGREGVLVVEGRKGIRLPNGLYLHYPNLRWETDKKTGKRELVYDAQKGNSVIRTRMYGPKLIENVCQALARIVIGGQMLNIAKRYRVVMTVHDSIGIVVPEDEAERAQEYVEMCMRLRPSWGMDLPLNCEAGYGLTYGDC